MQFTSTLKNMNLQYLQFCLETHIKALQSSTKQEWLLYHFEQASKLKEKLKRYTAKINRQINLRAAEEVLSNYKMMLSKRTAKRYS